MSLFFDLPNAAMAPICVILEDGGWVYLALFFQIALISIHPSTLLPPPLGAKRVVLNSPNILS